MQRTPFVSIIIPVYNVEEYLCACLDSVIEQVYKDWECICVDDGSMDSSGEILDDYSNKDPRFIVIHQKNSGVSAARNAGLASANGKWACFVDSDDWVGVDYLQHLVENISEEVDYVISGNESILDGKIIRRSVPSTKSIFALDASGAEPMADLMEQNLPYGPSNKLFRLDILKEHDISFPLNISYGEDLIFNFIYLKYVRKVATVPVSDYYYRQENGDSLSHKVRPDRFDNDYSQWCLRRDFLVSHNLWTKRIQNYMYGHLWFFVYDGLFENSADRTYSYIKKILSIPEIDELGCRANSYNTSRWIKFLILHRMSIFFYFLFKFKKIYDEN